MTHRGILLGETSLIQLFCAAFLALEPADLWFPLSEGEEDIEYLLAEVGLLCVSDLAASAICDPSFGDLLV